MTKRTILIIGVPLLILALFFVAQNVSFAPVAENPENQDNGFESETNKIEINPSISDLTLPLSNDPKDLAWAVFQKYLSYNKSKNLDGVKSVVYKIASVCEDPKLRIDCEARMGAAYSYGSTLKKEDFKNVWSDQNQIILSTDFWLESSEELDQYGRFRSIIFFIKGSDEQWKLLSFSPNKGGATNKGSASQEEVDDRIIRYTKDGDEDGIADYEEECLHTLDKETCTPTNPKLRDTNGNGFWDGVEALMK